MSLDALSTILPTPPVSQDTNVKAVVPAVASSASSDKGVVSRRVEASPGASTSNKASFSPSSDHVDERV